MTGELQFGIVGVAGRGGAYADAIADHEAARLRAVCDVDAAALADARRELDVPEAYEDYGTMLGAADLDGVVIGTPMPLHAPQSVAALERGVHVLSEVPAGVSVEECRDLVAAAADSPATYSMAENYTYTRPNVLVGALVREGLFGEVYYAEGEYLHELKRLNEETPWRREWQTGRNGVTYPTHSLGPVLEWFGDDRVARVTCAGSGHHYVDPRGDEYEQEDTTVMLCETEQDRLAKIRLDMLSERPHAMDNYALQGTEGAYESARRPGDPNRVWLSEGATNDDRKWSTLEAFEEYLPGPWRDPPAAVAESGHGGSDYLLAVDYLDALAAGEAPPLGVHEAMDLTLPGLASQTSIADDGAWTAVPDSRGWE